MNEPLPRKITIGEKYGPAMEITNRAEADAYFGRCVEHTAKWLVEEGKADSIASAWPEAERIERINLGYYAGYYDNQTRERVERLFRCAHPVFGAIATNGAPTPEQAIVTGAGMAAERSSSGGSFSQTNPPNKRANPDLCFS